MRLGKKLKFEDLLNMNGEEVYVKEIEHAELLKTPIQTCKVCVCVNTWDEEFECDSLGYEDTDHDYENEYKYEGTETTIILENSQHQYIYDNCGRCEDGDFEVYRKGRKSGKV